MALSERTQQAIKDHINDDQCILLLWALGTNRRTIAARLGVNQEHILEVLSKRNQALPGFPAHGGLTQCDMHEDESL